MRGIPGSGKTTRAIQISEETGAVVVSLDNIRANMVVRTEKRVRAEFDRQIDEHLRAGRSVVADATNIYPYGREALHKLAAEAGATSRIEFVDTPVEECIRRDANRQPANERIGKRGIYRWAKALRETDAWEAQLRGDEL